MSMKFKSEKKLPSKINGTYSGTTAKTQIDLTFVPKRSRRFQLSRWQRAIVFVAAPFLFLL